MTNNNKVRLAIVGYGNIGHRHAKHITQDPDAQLVAVCDVDDSKKALLPPGVLFYDSIEQLLAVPGIDVVSICTPNYLHERHTIATLKAGKHVLVEKPMAISTTECDNMIAASRETGKLIFAVKQNRYNPPVQEVKKLMDGGILGKIFMIQISCFWNRGDTYYAESPWRGKKSLDGGCLFTQFSHFVDILYYLNGTIVDATGKVGCYAHNHNTELEDSGSFVMTAQNGALINFNFTTCAYNKNMEGSITIFAQNGTVKIGGQYLNTIEYQQLANGLELPNINITSKSNDYGLYQGSMSNHDKVIQNVVDVMLKGHEIMTTAEEGREVVKMIEIMYAGAIKI